MFGSNGGKNWRYISPFLHCTGLWQRDRQLATPRYMRTRGKMHVPLVNWLFFLDEQISLVGQNYAAISSVCKLPTKLTFHESLRMRHCRKQSEIGSDFEGRSWVLAEDKWPCPDCDIWCILALITSNACQQQLQSRCSTTNETERAPRLGADLSRRFTTNVNTGQADTACNGSR